jgi:hypothetical protein
VPGDPRGPDHDGAEGGEERSRRPRSQDVHGCPPYAYPATRAELNARHVSAS